MEETLRNIVAQIAEVEPEFANSANLRDELYVDSVRALELLFEIEKQLGAKVPENRFGQVQTFQDLLNVVTSLKS